MNFEIFVTLLSGIATLIGGLLTGILSKRYSQIQKREAEEVEGIVSATTARTKEHRARALELLAEKLPATESVPQLIAALEKMSSRRADVEYLHPKEFIKSVEIVDDKKQDSASSFIQDLVNSYHHQALDQARVQFWFSIIAATIGFILIIYMVASAPNASELQLILKSLPGVAITTVAGLFFKQAGETRQRATELYDRLRSDNQNIQAMTLVESIDDSNVRSVVKAQLALRMAGLEPSPLDLTSVLTKLNHSEKIVLRDDG